MQIFHILSYNDYDININIESQYFPIKIPFFVLNSFIYAETNKY